jgi:hypothetical protein
VVNLFSRYEVPWSALHGIDLRAVGFHSGGEPLIYCLDFVTPTMETILAYMPRGNLRRMTDIRARILRARESLAIEPQSDAVIAVTGLVTVWHRLEPLAYRFEAAAANRLGPETSTTPECPHRSRGRSVLCCRVHSRGPVARASSRAMTWRSACPRSASVASGAMVTRGALGRPRQRTRREPSRVGVRPRRADAR